MKTIAFIILICLIGLISYADEIDDLIPAIIQVESGGDPNAISHCEAIGLMQITPIVLEEWHIMDNRAWGMSDLPYERTFYEEKDLYNPVINIKLGTWYLHRLKNHYLKENYTIERLLASYNGGISRLKKNNYDINKMPKETQAYVKKVMKLYKKGGVMCLK